MGDWKPVLVGVFYTFIFGASVKAVVFYIVQPVQDAAKKIAAVTDISEKLDTLIQVSGEQSAHILNTEEALIQTVRAVRSIGYAMREHGWNGSTDHILSNANAAEDILRATSKESCEEVMKV